MTSKKDYEAVAKILDQALGRAHGLGSEQERCSLTEVAYELANHFSQDNPRFDRSRFLAACGVQVPCSI